MSALGADNSHAALAALQADVELNKQKAIEDYRLKSANGEREARAGRINSGAAGIIEDGQNQKLDNFYNKDLADGQARSALQRGDASDEERSMVQPSERELAAARIRAARESGDLDPAHEAANDGRTLALEARNQNLQDRPASGEKVAENRETGRNDRAIDANATKLQAAQDKADRATAGERLTTQLNSNLASRKAHGERPHGKTPDAKAAWKKKDDDLEREENDIRSLMAAHRSAVAGDNAPAAAPTKPRPATVGVSNPRPDVRDARGEWEKLTGGK